MADVTQNRQLLITVRVKSADLTGAKCSSPIRAPALCKGLLQTGEGGEPGVGLISNSRPRLHLRIHVTEATPVLLEGSGRAFPWLPLLDGLKDLEELGRGLGR